MIKIDHTALYVHNLEATKDFFVRFFGAQPNEMYHNPKTDFRSYFLAFDEGTRLEIMNRPEVSASEKSLYEAGYTHPVSYTHLDVYKRQEYTNSVDSPFIQFIDKKRGTCHFIIVKQFITIHE